jgi:DNA-binding response OmpR family regulator
VNYKGHIVVVEDDGLLRKSIVNCYQKNNYIISDFDCANGVVEFIEQCENSQEQSVDIIVTDIVMPHKSGYELIESLKNKPNLGKIFISVNSALEDRIKGLRVGVDDYIGKPLDSVELLLRTEALLTRLKNSPMPHLTKNDFNTEETPTNIAFLHFHLNPESRFLKYENQEVELGYVEHQLLLLLIGFQGSVVSKQQISDVAYQQSTLTNSRTIDKLISRLRVKLVKVGGQAEYIIAQRGKGFMLVSQL